MKNYLDLLSKVLTTGQKGPDRTGHGTISSFGEVIEFDLTKGFPAVTTKRLAFKQVAAELVCFLGGYDKLSEFESMGCTIWTANGESPYWKANKNYKEDWLGHIYGVTWRAWMNSRGQTIDQLRNLIEGLKSDPRSRRHLVTAWNPGELDRVALPACHTHFQVYIGPEKGEVNCLVYMRSVDLFLGLPFDIASYATLTHLIAKEIGRAVGVLKFMLCDAHIYLNHIDQVKEQLIREPYSLPQLQIADSYTSIFEATLEQLSLANYTSHPSIKAEMNV